MADNPTNNPMDNLESSLRDTLVSKMNRGPDGSAPRPNRIAPPDPLPLPPMAKKGFFSHPELAKHRELVLFTEEFAMLMEMGVTVLKALQVVAHRTGSPVMRMVATDLVARLEQGSSLGDAMRAHPTIFSRYYLKSIQAGEISGNMTTALRILASYLEREENLRGRIRSAMMYPAITLCASVLVIMAILFFIVPAFAEVYKEAKMHLPTITQYVYNTSMFLRNFRWLVLGGVFVLIGLAIYQAIYQPIEELSTRILLSLPVVRNVMKKVIVYRFCRIMSMMTGSGVGLLASLQMACDIIAISKIHKGLQEVAYGVERGEPMSTGLRKMGIFPDIYVDMFAVGEDAGNLPKVFDRMANSLEGEISTFFESITNLLEPIMTLFVGVVVLIIAIALFLPYYSMSNLIHI